MRPTLRRRPVATDGRSRAAATNHQPVSKRPPLPSADAPSVPLRTPPWEPFRVAASAAARALVKDCIALVEAEEGWTKQPGQRGRRVRDRATFEAQIQALVCDLAYRCALSPDAGGAGVNLPLRNAVLRRQKTRYDAPWAGKTLPAVLKTMARPGVDLVRVEGGSWAGTGNTGIQPEVYPGPALLAAAARLLPSDFALAPAQEVILLKGDKIATDGVFGPSERAELIPYDDDATTHRHRETMRAINAWLAGADISVDPTIPGAERIDPGHRRLYRGFTKGEFTSGGRLWSGFWQNMRKTARHAIRIGGEDVTTIDFTAMAPVTLYAMAQAEPPAGDVYTVGPLSRWPRSAIKALLNACMFHQEKNLPRHQRGKEMSQWPGKREKSLAHEFPSGTKFRQVQADLHAAHPALVPHLYCGKGHDVQFVESVVMVDILLRLMDQGIVGLPLHDAVICQRSRAAEVKAIMIESFTNATGWPITVSED